ncbi:VOC family protein [Aureliella helgolandensis]|uniref:3-demethylubiquinone-9 3-methyltransferase n=1 Tax=Aureliella helgolandensis TaxID=2527968 RepID=A0A518GAV2_9BACT|nr:VOC family protein [Aureliella helgolandensis]QDV25731.1 3-demethylubiquinone-9 3-methyltransferase [Aureliella helgolandensis]
MQIKQAITPFLSYVDRAEEAAKFYTSTLPNSKILRTLANPMNGSVLTVEFELAGMKFVALNAGQDWKFTEAISLSISCNSQHELDLLWTQLSADGGREVSCGWLQDKFGMFWQIVPVQLQQWLESGEPLKIQRMFESLWQMKKLDIAALQQAFAGSD